MVRERKREKERRLLKQGEYEIGYKKPPRETQFKPGQSGNPRGRPPKVKNTYDILKRELNTEILLKEGNKQINLTKKQVLLRQLINKAVQGDQRSMFFVFAEMLRIEASDTEKENLLENISEEDNKILMRFLEENSRKKTKKGE